MRRSAPLLLLSGVMLATMLACQLSLPKSSAPLVATPTSPAHPNAAPNEPSVSGQQAELTALYDRVNGGVVSIQVITDQGGGQASGFVFDKQGHIVTNLHVVDGASGKVKWNVLPAPGVLSAQIRPPIIDTRRPQMLRPSPVPP